ncbi:MAG: hypothetical protein RLZZ189_2182, partial [Pseudomonadota bacterium]
TGSALGVLATWFSLARGHLLGTERQQRSTRTADAALDLEMKPLSPHCLKP